MHRHFQKFLFPMLPYGYAPLCRIHYWCRSNLFNSEAPANEDIVHHAVNVFMFGICVQGLIAFGHLRRILYANGRKRYVHTQIRFTHFPFEIIDPVIDDMKHISFSIEVQLQL